MTEIIPTCKECGCCCSRCNDHSGLHLHVEIENLKQKLVEKENHILNMETNFLREADKFPNGEVAAISEELSTWQDKYSRLYEAHKRVQKVNQNLEDKLLRIVDKCETEKTALTNEIATLTRRLVDEKCNVSKLQDENERYRNDVNLAIQLLQCKPSNFVSQKYDSLPSEVQQKVRSYLGSKRKGSGNGAPVKPEVKTIKVPIPTFPPTAMVYSVDKAPIGEVEDKSGSQVDIVSAAIMAKVLEERERERAQLKHCQSCKCPSGATTSNKSSQTCISGQHTVPSSCLPSTKNSKTSTILSIKNKANGDKAPVKDISENKTDVKNKPIKVDSWEADLDDLALSRARKGDIVTEGILVNLESPESWSLKSAASECSTLSWGSRQGSNGGGSKDSKEADVDLISFDKPAKCCERPDSEGRGGPRHCAVRMQVGTNNILLDNVVDPFTPILYKGRMSDPLVHGARSRSCSSASSEEQLGPHSHKSAFPTETEI